MNVPTKPFTPKQLLQAFAKDYAEAKTAEQINILVNGYAATLRDWKEAK